MLDTSTPTIPTASANKLGSSRLAQAQALAPWVAVALVRCPDLVAVVESAQPLGDALAKRWAVRRATIRKMFRDCGHEIQLWTQVPDLLARVLDPLPEAWHPKDFADWTFWSRCLIALARAGASPSTIALVMPLIGRASARDEPFAVDSARWAVGCAMLREQCAEISPRMAGAALDRAIVASFLKNGLCDPLKIPERVEESLCSWDRHSLNIVTACRETRFPALYDGLRSDETIQKRYRITAVCSPGELEALAGKHGSCLDRHALRLVMGRMAYFLITDQHDQPSGLFSVAVFKSGQAPLLYDVRQLDNKPACDVLRKVAKQWLTGRLAAATARDGTPLVGARAHLRSCRGLCLRTCGGGSLLWANLRAGAFHALPSELSGRLTGRLARQIRPSTHR